MGVPVVVLAGFLGAGTLTDPAAGLDAVVVEASGLAEPGVLVPLIAGAPGVAWGGLVLVADAVELESTAQRHPEVLAHLAAADVVLLTLLRERPTGLFRATGFLDLGAGHRYVLQVVGRQVRLSEGVPPGVRGSLVVCIGSGMDGDDVRARWAACVGGSDEAGLRDAGVLAGAS